MVSNTLAGYQNPGWPRLTVGGQFTVKPFLNAFLGNKIVGGVALARTLARPRVQLRRGDESKAVGQNALLARTETDITPVRE